MKNINLITVGVILDKHGLKGLVKVKYYTEKANNIEFYNPVTLSNNKKFNIKVKSRMKDLAICQIENISSANEAELLKGEKIYVERSKFPELENGEYYQADLIGCEVFEIDSDYIGKVMAVYDFGAGPILEIDKELFLFNNKNFPKINIKEKKIYMNLFELREDNE